jgi:hypothetical protein
LLGSLLTTAAKFAFEPTGTDPMGADCREIVTAADDGAGLLFAGVLNMNVEQPPQPAIAITSTPVDITKTFRLTRSAIG